MSQSGKHPLFWKSLGLLLAAGLAAVAYATFKTSGPAADDCPTLVTNVGALRSRGALEQALTQLQQNPTCAIRDDVQVLKAELTLALAHVPEAEGLFRALVNKHPENSHLWAQWGYSLAVQGNYLDAEPAFVHAVTTEGCERSSASYLIEVSTRLGHQAQVPGWIAKARPPCDQILRNMSTPTNPNASQ